MLRRAYARIEWQGSTLGLRVVNEEGQSYFIHAKPFLAMMDGSPKLCPVKLRHKKPMRAIAIHAGETLGQVRHFSRPLDSSNQSPGGGQDQEACRLLRLFLGAPNTEIGIILGEEKHGGLQVGDASPTSVHLSEVVETQDHVFPIGELEDFREVIFLMLEQARRIKSIQKSALFADDAELNPLADEVINPPPLLYRSYAQIQGGDSSLGLRMFNQESQVFFLPADALLALMRRHPNYSRVKAKDRNPERATRHHGGGIVGQVEEEHPERPRVKVYRGPLPRLVVSLHFGELEREVRLTEDGRLLNVVETQRYAFPRDEFAQWVKVLERMVGQQDRFAALERCADTVSWRLRYSNKLKPMPV